MKDFISRKNIRLKEYYYSKEGYYFITICIKNNPLNWSTDKYY